MRKCPDCNGKGQKKCSRCPNGYIKCRYCGGKVITKSSWGESRCSHCNNGAETCPDCHGRATVNCSRCVGRGEIM